MIISYDSFELVWLMSTSCFILLTLTTIIFGCICWKHKATQKDDLLGLDGMVKQITNPDENVNHMNQNMIINLNQNQINSIQSNTSSQCLNLSQSHHINHDQNNIYNKNNILIYKSNVITTTTTTTPGAGGRPSGGSNSNRSLPDIPRTTVIDTDVEVQCTTADTNSDIYATVDDKNIHKSIIHKNYNDDDSPYTTSITSTIYSNDDAEKAACTTTIATTLTSAIITQARPSLSQQSSLSQADAPYARLKCVEHPYDQLKKEHPYASVNKHQQPTLPTTTINNEDYLVDRNSNEILLSKQSHSPSHLTSEQQNQSDDVLPLSISPPPIAPPRIRRASSINNVNNSTITNTTISASIAVAGHIAANQELPYMTPPLIQQQQVIAPTVISTQQQHNFSGDSQDSSKGYTSISVREPLANILAQTTATANMTTRQPQSVNDTSHYATVSDDSDEMYAAIDEAPSTASAILLNRNHQVMNRTSNNQLNHVIEHDDVDLYTSDSDTYAQIIQPPSTVTPTTLLTFKKNTNNIQQQQLLITASQQQLYENNDETSKTLEPPQPPSVDSLKQVTASQQQQQHSRQSSNTSNNNLLINAGASTSSPKPEKRQANSPLPPRPSCGSTSSDDIADQQQYVNTDNIIITNNDNSAIKNLEDMYAKVHKNNNKKKLNINKQHQQLIVDDDVDSGGYNNIKRHSLLNNKIITSNNSDKLDVNNDNDPGYETLLLHKNKKSTDVDDTNECESECDPNYEVLKPKVTNNNITTTKTPLLLYQETSSTDNDDIDEPNYESMPHDDDEPTYESVLDKNIVTQHNNYKSDSKL